MKEILAIIPARGGSVGIPRKNVRALGGRPLISWTIGQALRTEAITRVVVSTDDREITASMNGNPASTSARFSALVSSVPSPSPAPEAHTRDTMAEASEVTDSDDTAERAAVVSKSWTVSE